MFGIYFGAYLVEKGVVSQNQLDEIIEKCRNSRVKLGLLATESGLMTKEQAEEVNQLQQQLDKRFGDIAVEKGYLDDDQVSYLLKQQGDGYLLFVQTISEAGFLSVDDISKEIQGFAEAKGYSEKDIEAFKSCDVDKEIAVFTDKADITEFYKRYIQLTARFIVRFVDPNVSIDKIKKLSEYDCSFIAKQGFNGECNFTSAFSGSDKAMIMVAKSILKEELTQVDMDTLDADCEFLNMNNGLFARESYDNGVEIDMLPPEMFDTPQKLTGEIILAPFTIHGEKLDLVIVI
ncbi:MAG: hypothetical protein K6F77_04165 [Lachnospiraceae bacterium]|nr:hypothetical protein [Lachnospiraceae bacterium]